MKPGDCERSFPGLLNRPLRTVVAAPFQLRHYVAAANIFRLCRKPFDVFKRYLVGGGGYPHDVELRTPLGIVPLRAYCADDVLTINEVFCRRDYAATGRESVIVDFGSNIGVSVAYFLSRGSNSFVYSFEPLPQNIERLKYNLERFEGRYVLAEAAVGLHTGEVQFGWEATGRYGGIGARSDRSISVECIDSNEVLAQVVERHGYIDILKIDVETLEPQIIGRLPRTLARKIGTIYVEYHFSHNPLSSTHDYRQYGSIAQFRPLDR